MIVFELLPGVGDMIRKQRFEVEFEGGPLSDAIAGLIKAHPDLAGDLLTPDGHIKSSLATFVNDERITRDERDRIELKGGDRVTILPPLFGG